MNNKRIIFLRSNPVDPDSRVEKEVNSLIKAGYNVKILAWDRNELYEVREDILNLPSGNVKIYRFGIPAKFGGGIKKNLLPLIKFQLRLSKWLSKFKDQYDIIHACDFDTAFTARKVAKKLNKKLVYDIFDYYVSAFSVPTRLKKIIEKMDHRLINQADATIICTEKRKEQISGSSPQKLTIIHNSPPVFNKKKSSLNLDKKKIKIAYVGILQDHRLLRELAEVVIDNDKYELHIGGFGKYEDYFKDLALKHNNVLYYGKIPYLETLELEESCDIMTALYDPSIENHYYAAPNKFYEALMLGKPLIMVKNTGMSEIVSEHSIGELIEYDKSNLIDAIENLVERKDEWENISQKMIKLYKTHYSWDEMERRLKKLYIWIAK